MFVLKAQKYFVLKAQKYTYVKDDIVCGLIFLDWQFEQAGKTQECFSQAYLSIQKKAPKKVRDS